MAINWLWQRKKPEAQKALDVSKHSPWREWMASIGLGSANVTHDTSLEVSTVLACARVISEDVAKYPLNVYRKVAGGKEIAAEESVFNLLHARPNSWQTSFDWREVMTMHAVLTGNGYSLISQDSRGNPLSLRPLMPDWVEVDTDKRGAPVYTVRAPGVEPFKVPFRRMFHLRGPSWDSVVGLDAVKQARKAIGLAMTTEKSQTKLHENGVQLSGILSFEGALSDEALDRLDRAFKDQHAGVDNAAKVLLLDMPGAKFTPTTMSGVDAEHIETRKHQIEEICRGLKVFPQMVGHSDKAATYASAEAFFAAHHEHTMLPWYSRWEQTIDRDLLDGFGPLFARFEVNRVLMASLSDQTEHFRAMREIGVYSADEIREIIGRNPRGDSAGSDYLQPLNMGTGDET